MSINIKNFFNNDDISVIKKDATGISVIEYRRDLSVTPFEAQMAYFSAKMGIKRRQCIIDMSKCPSGITLQAGAMQWMAGNVTATTGIKGAGDLLGKTLRGSVTGESAIKPEYHGNGVLALEPTFRHLILVDMDSFNGSVVLDDGLFLACHGHLQQKAVMRKNVSSAAFGGKGLFNLGITGLNGTVVLESFCPEEELIEVELVNDVLKIDGPLAIAWSGTLDYTVEKSGKSLLGSAASGEGLVNVYRGTGRVLMAPTGGGVGPNLNNLLSND